MSALLQPLEIFMPRADFRVQIDEQLKARVEALASSLCVDMNELVEHLVKRWVERTAPEEPDVTEDEVLQERRLDNGIKAALRGDLVPDHELEAEDAQMMAAIHRRQGRGG
jgi:predicted transcriptional regulator